MRMVVAGALWGLQAAEEADVVLEEVADVADAVAEHREAVDAHAEGEARVARGVVAHALEHDRVHHAAAEDLEPARALAHAALGAAPAADEALDVHLGAGLDEGEVARAEARLHVGAEEPVEEGLEHAA